MSRTSDSLRTADAFPVAASLRRRYFSEGQKRRPEMRLLFAGYTSDWLKQISLVVRPIRDTTQTWLVTRHQSGISALVPWTSFRGETSDVSPNAGCFLSLCKQRTCFLQQHIPL